MTTINHTWYRNEVINNALDRIGSSWIYDGLYLFVFPVIGVLSIIGNVISVWIFSGGQFSQKPLYTYLKVSCINSIFLNTVLSLNFIWNARRYLTISNTKFALYLRCYFKHPIMFGAYSYGSMIDIVLALERLCELSNMRDQFKRFRPFRVCLVLFISSILLNIPLFFVFEPHTEILIIDPIKNTTEEFYHLGRARFAMTPIGITINNIHYFIRDILSLILLIAINLATFFLFRRKYRDFVHWKEVSFCKNPFLTMKFQSSESNRNDRSMTDGDATKVANLQKENSRISEVFLLVHTRSKSRVYFRVAQANRMLTKMIFIICTFSTFEHIFLILGIHLFELYLQPFKVFIIIMANLVMLLNHSINFFIFYNYNSLFRLQFLKMISLSRKD